MQRARIQDWRVNLLAEDVVTQGTPLGCRLVHDETSIRDNRISIT